MEDNFKIELIIANPAAYLIRAGTHDPRAKGIKIPTAEQVCRVLETLYLVTCPETAEDYKEFADTVYEFTHIQNDPSCLYTHNDWADKFWVMWGNLASTSELRPKKKAIPKRKKCYT